MSILIWVLLALSASYILLAVDDLIVDAIAWIKNLKPEKIDPREWSAIARQTQKRIAILVPTWKEAGVIQRMLVGNVQNLHYRNYHIFVGVYPNDEATRDEVERTASIFAEVTCVVNRHPGPTCKAQMLNELFRVVRERETDSESFDAFVIHDAEDIIHPLSLSLINSELEHADYIQIPIFSLPLSWKQLVGGTYIDEFAENHTKDMLVRDALGAAIPSAGVGTVLSKKLVTALSLGGISNVFREGLLTEDYELGFRVHRMGFKPTIACKYLQRVDGSRDYIASREFFPQRWQACVRQKTRWVLGIGFQGWRQVGWSGGFWNRFFQARDRKGVFASTLTLVGYVLAPLILFVDTSLSERETWILFGMLSLASLLMANRLFQRSVCVIRVYGAAGALPILVRVPVANILNGVASVRAIIQFFNSVRSRQNIRWAKTDHELPFHFGTVEPPLSLGRPSA